MLDFKIQVLQMWKRGTFKNTVEDENQPAIQELLKVLKHYDVCQKYHCGLKDCQKLHGKELKKTIAQVMHE